jgi:hypothetical protein
MVGVVLNMVLRRLERYTKENMIANREITTQKKNVLYEVILL